MVALELVAANLACAGESLPLVVIEILHLAMRAAVDRAAVLRDIDRASAMPAWRPIDLGLDSRHGADAAVVGSLAFDRTEHAPTDGQDVYAVLANGGFLGMGEREVALPMDRISLQQDSDELVMRGMTDDEIDQLPQFDSDAAQELQQDQEIELSSL